jgi:uncharacterized protein YcbX
MSTLALGTVSHIYTYPLKGANGQQLTHTNLSPFSSIPNDRCFALLRAETIRLNKWTEEKSTKENADIVLETGEGKDPQHHSNKHLFHQLITDPQLGKYECVLSEEEDFCNNVDVKNNTRPRRRQLSIIEAKTKTVVARCMNLDDEKERLIIETFFAECLETANTRDGIPKLVFADGISFANVGGKANEHVLHIITKSTAREVYERSKMSSNSSDSDSSLDEFMMRFRANIIVDDTTVGGEPWSEFDWCGKKVRIGEEEVVLKINEPTIRCPSTRVVANNRGKVDEIIQPDIQIRTQFPDVEGSILGREKIKLSTKGSYFGLYASCLKGGQIQVGDALTFV